MRLTGAMPAPTASALRPSWFANRAFGEPPNQRVYDSDEHESATANNLLSRDPPHPVVIPGLTSEPDTENLEIWNRIESGNWNNP